MSIESNQGIRTLYYEKVEGGYRPDTAIDFTAKKEQLLIKLISEGSQGYEGVISTSSTKCSIETSKYQCIFEDNTGRVRSILSDLLN